MHSAAKSPPAGDWPVQNLVCVVGAPRCGTTTLARWLRDHPSVQLSSVKEPHYFSQFDLNGLEEDELRETVRHEFLGRYFTEIDPNVDMLADGSVSYLYTPERLLPLLRLWPDAKFIIGVRDPIELLPSLHQRLSYQGDETARDLETAWRLIEDRRAGRKIPRSCVESRQLIYDEVASLGKHVGHFFDVVGRDRCHVVVFDDLSSDPAKAYEGMLDFLGLPFAPLNRTRAYRARHGYRFGWLQRLLKRPAGRPDGASGREIPQARCLRPAQGAVAPFPESHGGQESASEVEPGAGAEGPFASGLRRGNPRDAPGRCCKAGPADRPRSQPLARQERRESLDGQGRLTEPPP